MKKLYYLLKVDALSILGINRLRHGGDKAERNKAVGALLLAAFVAVSLIATAVGYFYLMAGVFASLGVPELLLGIASVAGVAATIITSIVSAPTVLFTFRDFDRLLSLPIPVKTVALSRLLKLYLRNLLFTGLLLVSALIAYGMHTPLTVWFVLRYVMLLLASPLLPIAVAAALGTLIAKVGSGFRRSNAVRIVLSLGLVVVTLVLSFNLQPVIEGFEEIGMQLAESLYAAYPPARWFAEAALGDWGALLLFVAVNLVPFAAFAWLAARHMRSLHAMLAANSGPKRETRAARAATVRQALFSREARRYFSSTIYVTNTAIGPLMLLMAGIALQFVDLPTLMQQAGLPLSYVMPIVPYLLAWMLGMSTTTAAAISIEGKTIDQLKVLPVSAGMLLRTKLALHCAITLPAHAVAATLVCVALRPTPGQAALIYVLPAVFALLMGTAGLWLNLLRPKFDWKNETEVVKQGLPVFIMVFGSMLLAAAPAVLTVAGVADAALVSCGFTALCATGSALLWHYLTGRGARRFAAL